MFYPEIDGVLLSVSLSMRTEPPVRRAPTPNNSMPLMAFFFIYFALPALPSLLLMVLHILIFIVDGDVPDSDV